VDDSTPRPTEGRTPGRRPNYRGGVYARKDGRFDVQYTKRTSKGSKRMRLTVRTEAEAWSVLNRALGETDADGRWFNLPPMRFGFLLSFCRPFVLRFPIAPHVISFRRLPPCSLSLLPKLRI